MFFTADLTPLNNSGVFAHFSLTLDGNVLTVHEHATGLEPNMPHPQHIHGLLGANAPNTALATTSDDTDHDGYVELAEGQMSYDQSCSISARRPEARSPISPPLRAA